MARTGKELESFVEWLETLPIGYIKTQLADAFYKGQLEDSELKRAWVIHFHTEGKHSIVPQIGVPK